MTSSNRCSMPTALCWTPDRVDILFTARASVPNSQGLPKDSSHATATLWQEVPRAGPVPPARRRWTNTGGGAGVKKPSLVAGVFLAPKGAKMQYRFARRRSAPTVPNARISPARGPATVDIILFLGPPGRPRSLGWFSH